MEFTTDHWCDRYDSHLQALKTLKQKSPNWTLAMQKRMYEAAWLVFHFIMYSLLLRIFYSEHAKITREESKITATDVDSLDFAALERSVN